MALQDKPATGFFASSAKRNLILSLALVTATLVVYNAVTQNGFVNYDDDIYITSNRHVHAGLRWSTLSWAFTTFDAANWHPLTWISHALDCQVFKLNPAGHHYVNVLLHSACVVLLFLLLVEATQRTWPSVMAAAVFAVHPLNVESVAWAAERKNVLSMLFLLLALWAYQRYVRNPGIAAYSLVCFLFACGLMAKPQVITFPFLLLLWDYWPLQRWIPDSTSTDSTSVVVSARTIRFLVFEKLPLLMLSAASAMVTLVAQRSGGALRSVTEYPLLVRLENAVGAYFDYFARLLWPSRLIPMYPHPGDSLRAWQVGLAATFVVGTTALVLHFRQKRYLAVGWLWYLGTLVPMIGLVQVGFQATADRYMYLPMIGLLLMICWSLGDWAESKQGRMVVVASAAAAALVALGVLTVRQVVLWHDSETLWRHVAAVTENNFVAHLNLGDALFTQDRVPEATVHFRTAAQLRPNDPTSHVNLGNCDRRRKDYADALQEDLTVLRLTTDKNLVAYTYVNLGTDYRHLRDYALAKESYAAAVRRNPEVARAFTGLGMLAQREGDFAEAAKNYSRAVELEPSDIGYLLLAQILQQTGQTAAAHVAFENAQRISLDFDRTQQAVRELLAD